MKNSPVSKLSKLVTTVSAVMMILLLSSCRQEDSYDPSPGPTLVKLSVSASGGGVGAAAGDEASAVSSICILQFNTTGSGGSEFSTLRYMGTSRPQGNSGEFIATLLQSVNDNDKYKLVILANLADYRFLYALYGKSYEVVQQACLSKVFDGAGNVPDFDVITMFPMFGVVNDGKSMLINEATTGSGLGSVSLVRAVARVDIGVGTKQENDTWNKSGVKFDMTQVQIWKAGKQYAYMPLKTNFTSAAGVLTITAPSPVGVATETKVYNNKKITNTTYCSSKIYLPESDLQWGSVYDTHHTNRLAIIVGGKYNGGAETFYRVDFIDDKANPEDPKMNILRNHKYQFTIKSVTEDGYPTARLAYESEPKTIDFTAEIVPWATGKTESVNPTSSYTMVYGGLNGEITTGTLLMPSGSGTLTINPQANTWTGRIKYNFPYDYNDFYNESKNTGVQLNGPAPYNGDLYPTPADALRVEGVYRNLIISGDDISDISGSDKIVWRTNKASETAQNTLTAFDICRAYREGGFSDWRLPRLSELTLMYLNRTSIESQRGFSPFSGTYWSASETVIVSESVTETSDLAWALDFGKGELVKTDKASGRNKIRCVRQIK